MVHTFDLSNKKKSLKRLKRNKIFVADTKEWTARDEMKAVALTHEGQNGNFLSLYHTNMPCLIGVGSERQT